MEFSYTFPGRLAGWRSAAVQGMVNVQDKKDPGIGGTPWNLAVAGIDAWHHGIPVHIFHYMCCWLLLWVFPSMLQCCEVKKKFKTSNPHKH